MLPDRPAARSETRGDNRRSRQRARGPEAPHIRRLRLGHRGQPPGEPRPEAPLRLQPHGVLGGVLHVLLPRAVHPVEEGEGTCQR